MIRKTRARGIVSSLNSCNPGSPRRALGLAALTLLAACGEEVVVGKPFTSDDDLLKASDIIVAAQCELNAAAARADPAVGFGPAVLTMTLTVVVTEATGGGLTLAIPVAGSRVSLERGRRPIGSAIRQMEVQIIHDPSEDIDCPTAEAPTTADGVRYIEGGMGFSQWAEETNQIAARTGAVPEVVNYNLGFNISLSTSFNPVFSRSSDEGVSPDLSPENADARRVAHRIAVTVLPEVTGRKVSDTDRLDAAQSYLERLAPI